MAAKCPTGKMLGSQVLISATMVGLKEARISIEITSQPKASKALPTDLVPQNNSNKRGIFDIAFDFNTPDNETWGRSSHPREPVLQIAFPDAAYDHAEKESFLVLRVLTVLSLELSEVPLARPLAP